MIDSIALAGGLGGNRTPRTTAILENAVYSLLHLALQLPAGPAAIAHQAAVATASRRTLGFC